MKNICGQFCPLLTGFSKLFGTEFRTAEQTRPNLSKSGQNLEFEFQDRSHQPLDHPSELFVPRKVPLRTRWASRAAGPRIFSSTVVPAGAAAAELSHVPKVSDRGYKNVLDMLGRSDEHIL